LLPFFTMYLVRAYSWVLMFGPGGVINSTLMNWGLIDAPLAIFNYGIPAIIVGLTHAYFPYMLLTLYASLDGLDFSIIEAARDLGASRVEVFRDHVIPLTLPGIIGGSLFVFVPSVGAFITPTFLGQGKIQMIGMLIENRVAGTYSIGYASAASMFVLVSIIGAMVLAFRYVSIEELGGA
ncbi:ABC transporter permease, partial [Halorubrum sp. SS7]